jgi:nucleoside 2-deoxyribosyltransferase
MLILAGRYGSIEPTTNLSYTELEYDYAVAKGKPTFAVVIKEAALEQKVKNGGTAFIEKENPKALSVFREKVLKNISSFFSDPKDVTLCVYESMSDYAANPDLKGWVAGGDVAEVKSMQEELRLLRDDNQELRRKLASTGAQTSQGNKAKSDKELLDVLRAIKVKIPANLAGGKEVTLDLFRIVHGNRDTLITGVTNSINSGEAEHFFFFNIIPKLQAHRLADCKQDTGVKYRRGFLNAKGQEFFASMEKALVLSDSKEDCTTPAEPIDQATGTSTTKVKPRSRGDVRVSKKVKRQG